MSRLFALDGRVALLIGGTAGIGLATAEAMVGLGAHVVIAGRRTDVGAREAERIGADFVPVDVSDTDSVDRAIAHVINDAGGLDIAVNGVGLGLDKPTVEIEDEEFAHVVDVNFGGIFRCCRAEGRVMLVQDRPASIINIASMSAHIVNHPQSMAVYNATKAAITHYSRSLAVEWASAGVRVNSVSPGYTQTAMTALSRSNPKRMAEWEEGTPLGRIAQANELAGAISYLASGAASFTTGTDIVVDGGYTLW